MYGINLQLFNSKLRISIFDNLPKKVTCGFAQIAQNSLRFMRKNSAKVRKKNLRAKDLALSWKP